MPSISGWAGAFGLALSSILAPNLAAADVVISSKSDPTMDLSAPELGGGLRGPMTRAARTAPPMRPEVPELLHDYAWVDTLEKVAETDDRAQACMTEALYFEARGEGADGVFAVAEVILNRVDHWRFPDTVCGVVEQGTGKKYECQFSYRCDGIADSVSEPAAWDRMAKIAHLMLEGAPRTLADGATYYHTKAVAPYWADVFDRVTTIGYHHFYYEPYYEA